MVINDSTLSSIHIEKLSLAKRWHLDLPLLFGLFILTIFGLMVFYSAADHDSHLLKQQVLRLVLGFMLMFGIAQVEPRRFIQWAPWIFTVTLILLIATLLFGIESNGAQRWLSIAGIRFQPSELAKLTLPLLLGFCCYQNSLPIDNTKVAACLSWIFLTGLLVIVEPDLGTGVVIIAIGLSGLFLAGCDRRWLWALLILALSMVLLLDSLLHDYQLQRILNFLEPERDPLGSGYHIIQAKISIGSGGLFGKGWLNSVQANLDILGERMTDFIFAVAAEEFGWLGSLFIVSLYVAIVWRCLWLARQAQRASYYIIAGSLAMAIFLGAFCNIAMNSGAIPVVGLPLPLISFGGTSMFSLFIALGIIMAIGTQRTIDLLPSSFVAQMSHGISPTVYTNDGASNDE